MKERAAVHFEQRYTMASERNIHRGQGAQAQGGKRQSIVGAEEVEDLDSILF